MPFVTSSNHVDDSTFTLVNGAATGRQVLILAAQYRTTANIANFSINGVSGTAYGLTTTPAGSSRTLAVLFQDSDLPASAGTYSVSRNTGIAGGTEYTVIELSGMDGAATPEVITKSVATGVDPETLTFTNSAGAYLGVAVSMGTADGGLTSAGAGQDIFLNESRLFTSGKTDSSPDNTLSFSSFAATNDYCYTGIALAASGGPQEIRKGSQFDIETTLSGTVTAAALNGNAITVDSQVGTTVTLTDSGSAVTTSGEYNLVLTDDSADPDETIVVQVNVYGVAPSNNPLQKDGSALASLTGVQLRVTDGANLNGSELYYSGTGTTDASGNLGNIDLSSTAAADADPVLLHMRTSAGDSIIASETVGLI